MPFNVDGLKEALDDVVAQETEKVSPFLHGLIEKVGILAIQYRHRWREELEVDYCRMYDEDGNITNIDEIPTHKLEDSEYKSWREFYDAFCCLEKRVGRNK